ncbi:hypothetical protein OG423_14115 [Micromonospora zamorensis]|uniref:phage tail tube protein n=1 Tax=Micromonospora zamorensis TaxID=709883 RepID=UPI00352A48FC|nr:hypothetical protein OG423_14115 [Micromonospora zamorensis]
MADIPVDGNTRVAWVPAVSNKVTPTTTELNAGILLQSLITADGLAGFEPETADVDTTSLASTFNTLTIGRDSFSGTMLRLKKQDGTDTAYNTLIRGASGYIVIRRHVTETTAWAAGQKVQVFPVICGQTRELAPEANTVARYEVPTKINATPELRATVA